MRAILRSCFTMYNSSKMFQNSPGLQGQSMQSDNMKSLSDHKFNTVTPMNKSVLMDVSQSHQANHISVGMHTSSSSGSKMAGSSEVMSTLVVGLGNHSMSGTRHSVGMAIADQLCRHLESTWKKDSECQGMVAMATLDDNHKLILLKPRLFINVNGRSVLKTVTKYQIPVSNVFLLHDDLDRPLGKYSIKEGGSAGGHNGVKSVINCLGTNRMLRLRFGIDRPTNPSAVADYVLEKFTMPEKQLIPQLLEESVRLVLKRIKEQTIK